MGFTRSPLLVKWCAPPPGWVKVNVDAAMHVDSGFRKATGMGGILNAELWAVFTGLELA